MEVAERLILSRQAVYRFLAGLLLYPEAERLDTLKAGAKWLAHALADDEVSEHLNDPDRIADLVAWVAGFDGDLEAYQAEWVRLFGSSRDGYCFPYEGAYRGPQAAGPLLAALQKEYARAGLALSSNDLPDHISVELEYMSYLCGLELETLRSGADTRRGRIIKAQYMFLENHLCQWLPVLRERVVESKGGPFELVCEAAARATNHDRAFLASIAANTQERR